MSPINPPAPPPTKQEAAKATVKTFLYHHDNDIEVVALGIVLGVLVLLVNGSLPFSIGVVLTFCLGAVVEALLRGSR